MSSATVTTGSRLHFGLTRVQTPQSGRLGGVGVMIEEPATQVRVFRDDSRDSIPEERALHFARKWIGHLGLTAPWPIGIEVQSPEAHCGLGSGTQLAQSVAAAINAVFGLPHPDILDVSRVLQRGGRSLVGSLGFAQGGLIVDRAWDEMPETQENAAPHFQRVALNEDWRVVLWKSRVGVPVSGETEQLAFRTLDSGSDSMAERLEHLADHELIPAAEQADFNGFTDAVQRYGSLSGEYYRAIQGGIYNGPVVAAMAGFLQQLGSAGVGQSSWGPTVFCWCRDPDEAAHVSRRIAAAGFANAAIHVSPVRNQPATVHLAND